MQNYTIELDIQQWMAYISSLPYEWSIGLPWAVICLLFGTPIMRHHIRKNRKKVKVNPEHDALGPIESVMIWAVTPIWLPFWLLWMMLSWGIDE